MRNPESQGTHQFNRAGKLIASLNQLRDRLILLEPKWLPAMLLIPLLYVLGWIICAPLVWLGLSSSQHSLAGTLTSVLLLVLLLPAWCRCRWDTSHCWRSLGISGGGRGGRRRLSSALLRGLLLATFLLALVTVALLMGSWAHWLGEWSLSRSLNALALLLVVGLTEELIFRGWLWRELDQLIGPASAVAGQALIFSLVHTRFNLGFWPMLTLLIGLLLLGLCLAVQRRLDGGSLWGCVGLHGGLVAGWFLLQSGLLQLSPDAPSWLVGPGGSNPNPLGGAIGLGGLLGLLSLQLTAVARALRPVNGARRAS
ncbi:MAG: Uncharacterised protein [Synechococcus sp. CC9902]|nr:MAG: Uncharacterised protein [Synechococcus sp. CC9902]